MPPSYRTWWYAFTGPTVHRVPSVDTPGQSNRYQQNQLELTSSTILQTGNIIFAVCKWMSILCFPWVIPRVYAHFEVYTKSAGLFCVVYLTAMLVRGAGRITNPSYRQFLSLYEAAHREKTDAIIDKLVMYAFSSKWPAQFDVRTLHSTTPLRPQKLVPHRPDLPGFFWPLTWIIARTIGICLVYPGCTWIMNTRTLDQRLLYRDRLRRMYSLKVIGLNTRDGEFVEAFYADRRGSSSKPESSAGQGDSKGDILIVCCEGNGGYPEIGVPLVPLGQGYSILAWNHPGFGQSTGSPFPEKEHNAIEAVMLFATERLKFPMDHIYLFGWSIGGYTASWAAMNFPEIGGLILDATFDDLDTLTSNTMPDLVAPLALASVHNHLDLNNVANLVGYDGPIRMIRRGEDEIISTSNPPTRDTNRGNFLLVGLLKHRFPHLMTPENRAMLDNYLALDPRQQDEFLDRLGSAPEDQGPAVCEFLVRESASRKPRIGQDDSTSDLPPANLYPSNLGSTISDPAVKQAMLFFLVTHYFTEAPDSHCAPLNPACFLLPWSPRSNSSVSSSTSPINGVTTA